MVSPEKKFNKNGKLIYERDRRGVEYFYTPLGEIKEIKSNGAEGVRDLKREFDRDGNVIYYEEGDYWVKKKYNDKGKITYSIDSRGYEFWREYDNQGIMTYSKDSENKETWQLEEGTLVKRPNGKFYLNGNLCVKK